MRDDQPLPVFVYGSLRRGQQHHRVVRRGLLGVRLATLEGVELFDAGPYPYLLPGSGSVRGELLDLAPTERASTLATLDRLEGYLGPVHPANHYERLTTTVVTDTNETVLAWVYMAAEGRAEAVRVLPRVPRGDWCAYLAARRAAVDATPPWRGRLDS